MKLKQLFENTQPPMTDQEAHNLIKQHFPGYDIYSVRVGPQGDIHVSLISTNFNQSSKIDHISLQLTSVEYLKTNGLETLNNLPLLVKDHLIFGHAKFQDLSTASPVVLRRDTVLRFHDCPNLTSLKGLENFKVEGGGKISKIEINKCPNLAIDLFDYRELVSKFQFSLNIPHNVKLVRATTMANMVDTYVFDNIKLKPIINNHNYRGQGWGAALKMANELRAAELEHHVDWAQ